MSRRPISAARSPSARCRGKADSVHWSGYSLGRMKGRLAGSILLISTAGLFGGDNVLTPQEKAAGWVLLFDGKSLNGWTSAIQEAPARSGGAARSGAPEKAKGSAQPGAAPAVGSNPRTCSTPEAQAAVAEG